jgi:hypothetical protein
MKLSNCSKFGFSFLLIASVCLIHCDKNPVNSQPKNTGSLEVRVQFVENLAKSSLLNVTTADTLMCVIFSSDMDTLKKKIKLDLNRPQYVDTIKNIPSGSRKLLLFTKNKNGDTIHVDSLGIRTVIINPNQILPLNAKLLPRCGSLYIQLGEVPTSIDTICAQFISMNGREWKIKANRATKMTLNLDNIPHLTEGNLTISGIDKGGTVTISSTKHLTFNAYQMNTLTIDFQVAPGSIAFTADIVQPGVTLVNGNFQKTDSSYESGKLIITEIMYAADSNEYIEIYNPSDSLVHFDILILQVDNSSKKIFNINVAADSFLVIGRKAQPWIDIVPDTASIVNLALTGNWITLRAEDLSVIDRVVVVAGSNSLEWPNLGTSDTKRSIELDILAYDPNKNNFGRYWHAATSLIDSSVAMFGSPGR